ncbi:MAG: hypothetical protein ACE3L7_09365 [Candidatus Pristimantibacillus sp.]
MTKLIYSQLVIIVVLCIGLFISYRSNIEQQQYYRDADVLIHKDKTDLKRVEYFVERFKDKKGDYLMIVEPSFDSGQTIHDVWATSRVINWTSDYTRDIYSTVDKQFFECGDINRTESDRKITFSLSECKGYDKTEQLPVLFFIKDE